MQIPNPIICAVDTADINLASHLIKLLKEKVSMIKLGLEFFTAHGLKGVDILSRMDIPIFLDLKLHDIPVTVYRTISVLKILNIEMLTIHISGGEEMMKRSVEVLSDSNIKLIGVTVLTSLSNYDLNNLGITNQTEKQAIILAELAKKNHLNGIVCSPNEILTIRKQCGQNFKIIVPGIRNRSIADDQKRVQSSAVAVENGADYIVIGRPITESNDPLREVDKILSSIENKK